MKRLVTFLLGFIIATSVFAYDFENTYFKGSMLRDDGKSNYMYLEFREGGKVIVTLKIPGAKIEKENATWTATSTDIMVNMPIDGQVFFTINYERVNNSYRPYLVMDVPYPESPEFTMISEETYKKETTAAPPVKKTSKPAAHKRKK